MKQVNEHYLPKLLAHHPITSKTAHEASARNRLFNVDGFGLAYYTPVHSNFSPDEGLRPVLFKIPQPPLHDMNFHSLAPSTSTLSLLAHIRAATDSPIIAVNNHPFAFGRHTIMQ